MNDPQTLGIAGFAALALAVVSWLGDRRRRNRRHIDAVGFMDWTSLFFFATFAAVLLLGLAARMDMAG